MIELLDQTAWIDDPERLAASVASDGYLFFRGLFDAGEVAAVRSDILATIDRFGWLAPDTAPEDGVPGPERRVEGDAGYWAGYRAVQALESVHRIGHSPRVVGIFDRLFGEPVTVHPRNFVRIVWPDPAVTTSPHQDFTHVGGTVDFFTCWTPLAACPRSLGGLRVLRGSQHDGVRPLQPAPGAGGVRAMGVADDDPRWATADFEPGDAVVFHAMTVHAGMPNVSDRLRISIDNRYQPATSPMTTWSARPHDYEDYPALTAEWHDFTTDWSTTRWVSLPPSTVLIDAPPMAHPAVSLGGRPPKSRFVDTTAIEAAMNPALQSSAPQPG